VVRGGKKPTLRPTADKLRSNMSVAEHKQTISTRYMSVSSAEVSGHSGAGRVCRFPAIS